MNKSDISMSKNFVIAIDGFSSCGKSTLARSLAKSLGFTYIDTGAMYRACTLYFLENNVDSNDEKAVKESLDKINDCLKYKGKRIFFNERDITKEIRSMEVSEFVSNISAVKAVRSAMTDIQRHMGSKQNVVMDGRDIGTAVFPDAQLKIFMTADINTRALRRWKQLKQTYRNISLEEVSQNIQKRDKTDINRSDSPLVKSPEAIEIDNSFLDQDQQLELAINLYRKQRF